MPPKKKFKKIKKKRTKGYNCCKSTCKKVPATGRYKNEKLDSDSFLCRRPFASCRIIKAKLSSIVKSASASRFVRATSRSHKQYKHGSDSSLDRRPFSSSRPIIIRKTSQKSNKHCDSGGVKSIYSPFLRLTSPTRRNKKMPLNEYRPTGMSSKEKSYVISSCQSRGPRYLMLKKLAKDAIKEGKIFMICGSCPTVRKALTDRGWVEKVPDTKMNLTKIRAGVLTEKAQIHGELEKLLLSNLVEKYLPNFIWKMREAQPDTTIDMKKEGTTIINKLKTDAMWTSKQGLCSSMKRNYWFYIEDEAEVNGPRTYNIYDSGEKEGFVKDYNVTACTSLLKWILAMVANDRPIFIEGGKLSIKVMIFALNRCKDYLSRKQNEDLDRPIKKANNSQWAAFLKKYYRLINKEDVFEEDKDNKLPIYLAYAKFLLKEIHRFRPQLSCEGCHNIWIIKPAHCSRGRGIRMASKLTVIMNLISKANSKYVIQKYIEEPILIHETKFDIRQYYLITSTYPLVIWMYKDCYLKFSSQKYNLKNYHESIHLTNNAVQKKYTNCRGRHEELPRNNMWDSERYKDYLNKIGKDSVWDNIIYPGMKKSIVSIMLSCQDSLSLCKNRFELYGCDFILDKEYKPWLIEINSCPDLNHTTPVTAKICPAVIADIIKVVIDYPRNSKCSTGKFECIYNQPISIPKYGVVDMAVRGYPLPPNYFYRGNVVIKESYDDTNIGNNRDLEVILHKLKKYYEPGIMIEQDESSDTKHDSNTHRTESEDELSEAATVITEQLEELMDKITTPPDNRSSRSSTSSLWNKDEEEANNIDPECSRSETNIQSLLKESEKDFSAVKNFKDILAKRKWSYAPANTVEDVLVRKNGCFPTANSVRDSLVRRYGSFSTINSDQDNPVTDESFSVANTVNGILARRGSFNFSELDENDSNIDCNNIARTHYLDNKIRDGLEIATTLSNNVLKATTKIVSFIKDKQKEYSFQSR